MHDKRYCVDTPCTHWCSKCEVHQILFPRDYSPDTVGWHCMCDPNG